jgi:hypothetical protein
VQASATAGLASLVASSQNGAQSAVRAFGKTVPASASVPVAGNAKALEVLGIASFTRSGVINIPAGAAATIVNVPGGLSATSHVLATVQNDLGVGTPAIRSAVLNPATAKVGINLTAAVPAAKTLVVAWFVFG